MRCARRRAGSRVPRAPPRNWAYLDRRSNQRLENSESTGIISRLRSFPFGLPDFCLPSDLYNFVDGPEPTGLYSTRTPMLNFQRMLKLRSSRTPLGIVFGLQRGRHVIHRPSARCVLTYSFELLLCSEHTID